MSTLRAAALAGLGLALSLVAGPTPAAAAPPPAAAPAPAAASSPAVDPEALQALQRMSTYLGTLNAFEVKSQTSLDLVTVSGQRIQLDGVASYKVRRPDGFVIDVSSDLKKRKFFYDGKHFTVFAPELGYYATAAAPPTIIKTLDVLWDRFGIALPLEDLFRWNDQGARRRANVTSGFDVGPATIDGVATEQYAFREGDIDWQVWIQEGDQPLPRKLVIVDRTDPTNPAYIARLTWTLNPVLNPDDFAFRPGKDAKSIRLTSAGK